MLHKPVLLEETLDLLSLKGDEMVVDGTLGSGGHSTQILQRLNAKGRLIGMDQDPAAIERCRATLGVDSRVTLVRSNFIDIDKVLSELNIPSVDAVLIDTGFSSDQMEDAARGLSFDRPGPLDMRLDPSLEIQASDLVNDLSQHDLEEMFRNYGEDRHARSFARVICEFRRKKRIETTQDLVEALANALPPAFRAPKGHRPKFARRHFATRVFQALRISVNRELKNLEEGLNFFWNRLNYAGRLMVITFHSLEDRIVKYNFREKVQSGEGELLCKKPLQPKREETLENPRARSAKLRGIQKRL